MTLAFIPPAEPPPTPPAIYAPAPREISFGEIRGRVTAGTRLVSIRVDGVYKGYANLDGRRFWKTISLPSHDVAIRITYRLAGAGLVARKLGADRTVLCASPAYLARKGTPKAPADLVHHDCLVYSLLKEAAEWRFRVGKRTVSVPIDARFSAASGAVLRGAALAGMGLAVLPRFMIAGDLDAGRLRPVIDSFEGVALGIYAVYPMPMPQQGGRPSPKVRAFVDLLVAHFRAHPL